MDGQTATVQVQGTGPSAPDRVMEFRCQFNIGESFLCKLEIEFNFTSLMVSIPLLLLCVMHITA